MKKLNPAFCYIILTVFTFIIYFNTLSNDFVFDDESIIQNNLSIQTLSNIPKFFTGSEGFAKVIGSYYRPIVSVSYAVDYSFWKLDPAGYHLTNIIVNIVSVLILFRLLFVFFEYFNKDKKKREVNILIALLGALFFAAHPVHTEAVSWISGRTDSIVTLFFFASFLYYVKLVCINEENKENEKKFWILSLLFYSLGLLSKEMIVTMPLVIILFDTALFRSSKKLKENLKYYLSFAVVTLVYLAVRYLALKDIPGRPNYNYFVDQNGITTTATMLKTIPYYFKLLVYPVKLLYHYNGFIPDSTGFLEPPVLYAIAFLLVLVGSSIYLYKRGEGIPAFCILFFLVTLTPVMNIIPTMNLMAERFLYLTSFGLVLAVCYTAFKYRNKDSFTYIVLASLTVTLLFSYLTFERNKDWKNNDALYSTADGVDGTVLLVNAGNIYANNQQYDEAAKRYKRAMEIRDKSVLAHHNMGLIYFLKGQMDSAEIEFKKGISIDSLAPDGYFRLSNLYKLQGRIPEAVSYLERLQTIFPNYKESANMLAELKSMPVQTNKDENLVSPALLEQSSYKNYQEKKYDEAIKDLERLIKINPLQSSGYYNNIAMCYTGMGKNDNAREFFQKAIDADPKNVNALNGMADLFLKDGNTTKAKEYYKKILVINPADINANAKLDSLK